MAESDYFGQLLTHYRHEQSWSQKELAERAKVSESTLGNLESGRIRRPHLETVRLLAAALNLGPTQRQQFLDAARRRATVPPAPPNLPNAPSSFIGREHELVTLRALLSTTRLLTLVGTGGCGKTRLVLELARGLIDDAPGGIWWVDLASVLDAEGIAQAVLAAVDARPPEQQSSREALNVWVAAHAPWLILDNCEHLHEACAELAAALLRASSEVRVLTTSRRPLGLPGERVWRVPPLSLPAAAATTAKEIGTCEAIQLLIERTGPDFALTDQNAGDLAALCRRLDGLPLALELAAARLHALDAAALVTRLDGYFALLGKSTGSMLPRHETIRAVLDWSYDNLAPAERILLHRLAPFVGGFTLAAAEAVGQELDDAACPPAKAAHEETVPGLLTGLVEQSLVVAEGAPGGPRRYQLLETIRAYTREKLAEAGEAAAIGARHCAWLVALAERVPYPLDGGPKAAAWRADLAPEVDNLRAALTWARDNDPAAGLRLIGAVWPYWLIRLSHAEGRAWLNTFLAAAGGSPQHHAAALHGLGYLCIFDQLPVARATLTSALALAEEAGDPDRVVAVRWLLAFACLASDDPEETATQLAAGWEVVARDEQERRRTPYRMMRGLLALEQGELASGRAELLAVDATAVALDQPFYRCIILARLGGAYLKAGDPDHAIATYTTLLRVADSLGSWFYRYVGRNRLALAREWSGDLEGAKAEYEAALALSSMVGGSRLEQAVALLAQGRLALYQGEPYQALTSLEASTALLNQLEHPPLKSDLAYALGLALWRTGQRTPARAQLNTALTTWVNDPARLALRLEGVAGLAAEAGEASLAARWLGGAGALRARTGASRPPVEEPAYDASRTLIGERLGSAAAQSAEKSGRTIAIETIVTSARAWLSGR
jgi:predicted ATPase/DNA-binding XRE family transcriptional regulator/tetratricopeptide (TPR) repeat protein